MSFVASSERRDRLLGVRQMMDLSIREGQHRSGRPSDMCGNPHGRTSRFVGHAQRLMKQNPGYPDGEAGAMFAGAPGHRLCSTTMPGHRDLPTTNDSDKGEPAKTRHGPSRSHRDARTAIALAGCLRGRHHSEPPVTNTGSRTLIGLSHPVHPDPQGRDTHGPDRSRPVTTTP